MSYQDIWRGGTKGERECASRYAAVSKVLGRYRRPFTMLDLGASEGYFSFRAAEDFDCTAVMVEGGEQLLPLCADQSPTILLQHRITAEELETLADCEHFDVVLALNVLHHFEDWHRALSAVLRLGGVAIIETPPKDDTGACGQGAIPGIFDAVSHYEQIASTPSHTSAVERPMVWAPGLHCGIRRCYVDSPSVINGAFKGVSVDSSLDHKRAVKGGVSRDWVHGINLRTYQRLGGVWPPRETVARWVEKTPLPSEKHGDVRPWNFILDERSVHLIDGRDEKAIYDDAEGLDWTLQDLRGVA